MSVVFRCATIYMSEDSIFRQRFVFFGGCTPAYPPYTPLGIFFNRSVTRPLVRASIISAMALRIPAFAFYSIWIVPSAAQIYTKSSFPPRFIEDHLVLPVFITFLLTPLGSFAFDPTHFRQMQLTRNRTMLSSSDSELFKCSFAVVPDSVTHQFNTPPAARWFMYCRTTLPQMTWVHWYQYISISFALPIGTEVLVTLVRKPYDPAYHSPMIMRGVLHHARLSGVPLLAGSNLFGVFTWSSRELSSPSKWGISSTTTTLHIAEINGLQENCGVHPSNGITTLTLLQQTMTVSQYFRDAVDETAITGVSTFGGFWSFINGAFALLFGANILYFMFGWRPLSALGIVHIFQRRTLTRKWHEDFPRLRKEGGEPGSDCAGIVAFIRERLVDVDGSFEHPDSDAQQFEMEGIWISTTGDTAREASPSPEADEAHSSGHTLGNMEPQMDIDVDLGMHELRNI
ncbi:hypothetical protein R3P38DRAFT_2805600 [Favolaschia claudopus]|uniref:Uncharacterized protein n=1 Tax=Favolaschia claudopus TaxID=2862362 RepID=A0AAV9ZMY1_9AGAR